MDDFLMYAAHAGHLEYIRKVVDGGGDGEDSRGYPMNFSMGTMGFDGRELNILAWATRSGRMELVKYILTKLQPGLQVDHLEANSDNKEDEENDSSTKDNGNGNGYSEELDLDDAIEQAALCGHVDIMKLFYKLQPNSTLFESEDFLETSIRGGNLKLVQFLYNEAKTPCPEFAPEVACEYGHVSILEHLYKNASDFGLDGYKWTSSSLMDFSAEHGQLAIIKYLHENIPNIKSDQAATYLAQYGYVDALKYFIEIRREECRGISLSDIIHRAPTNHIQVVRMLHEHGIHEAFTGKVEDVDSAARCGLLEVVKFLIEVRKQPFSTEAVDKAAEKGYMDVIKYLVEEHDGTCTRRGIDFAAKDGRVDVVEYLLQKTDVRYSPYAIQFAEKKEREDVLRVLKRYSERLITDDVEYESDYAMYI
jgi:ankyrin repeat protein